MRHPILALLLAALAAGGIVQAATPPAKPAPAKGAPAKAPAPPKPVEEPIAYEKLEQQVGKDVAIETTFNTVRRGRLVKYTNAGLTVMVKPEEGGYELSVPRETVRQARLVLPPPDPIVPNEDAARAKKN